LPAELPDGPGLPIGRPRFKAKVLQAAWKVLKTTILPRAPISPSAVVPTSAPLLREGELFDNTYRLLRLIGEGAIGAVYEATHARLAGRYAIKLLLVKPTVASQEIALFAREARITSLLQHPNIVHVVDHNTTADGTEYLVMEYLAGESLAQRLAREAPLPLDTVVGIVDQIAAGLAAAHANHVVHRDLKPDNVFLVPVEGRAAELVKILDFGISKVKGANWGRQAPEGTVMGTPLYMAPEQIEGRVADADAATDQFALAVIAYEMLTGRNPFRADTPFEVFALVLQSDPAPMGIGRDVELVVRRGLAKSNRQRFPAITDFSDALRAAAAGRLRETQWAATLAYAAGEVASQKSKGRSGRRVRRVALAAAVVASIWMAFVVGGALDRHSSGVRGPSTVERAAGLLVGADPRDARDAQQAEADAESDDARDAEPKEMQNETQNETDPRAGGEIDAAVEPTASPARREQWTHVRRGGSSATTRQPASARPSVDEDATMPATEPSN
jgi:tRNA A-37 threonylcarbamoyl transferase component Bud32